MSRTTKDGFSVLGVGAAACVACCAGPILAFLGGISVAGIASTWLIGGGGLAVAAVAAVGFLIVSRRRQRASCAADAIETTPVELTRKAAR